MVDDAMMSLVGPDVVDDVLHSGVRLHVRDHDIWNTKRRHVTKCTCNDNIIIYTRTIHHALQWRYKVRLQTCNSTTLET